MRWTRPIQLLILVTALAGCAADPAMNAWTDRWLRAEHLIADGQQSKARIELQVLINTALSEHDRVLARLRLAETWSRERMFPMAIAILQAEAKGSERLDLEQRAKIHYLHARAVIDSGDDAAGEAILQRLMNRWPDSTYGGRAFIYLRGIYRGRGLKPYLSWLMAMYQRHKKSGLADNLLYRGGHLYYELGTVEGDAMAEDLFQRILTRWGFESSGLWDDALWELSFIYHRRGRFDEELDLLERLLSNRSTTWLGSEQIENYRFAHIRIGRIHYFKRRDYARAAQQFAEFQRVWPTSILVDDMIWWEAHARLKAGQDDRALALFNALKTRFPDSKWTRRVMENKPGPTEEDPP